MISAPAYNRARAELQAFLERHSLAKKVARHARRFEEALKGLMVPGLFFEELGFRYFGPIDCDDLDVLFPTLKNILPLKGTKVLHVVTKKGAAINLPRPNPNAFTAQRRSISRLVLCGLPHRHSAIIWGRFDRAG